MGLFGPPNVEKMQAKRDVKGLIKALRYKSDQARDRHARMIRNGAAPALKEIGDLRAVAPLIAALKDSDNHVGMRAASALGQIGDARAIAPLIVALKERDRNLSVEAACALAKIGAPTVAPLIVALKERDRDVRAAAANAFSRILDVRAVEPLIAALKDSDSNLRSQVPYVLGKIGDVRAVAPLIAALEDSDGKVRRAAAEALGRMGDARAVAALIAGLEDSDGKVRRAAAEALGRIGDVRAVAPLVAALKNMHQGLRKATSDAPGKIGGASVVQRFFAALADGDSYVAEMTAALDKLGWRPGQDEDGAAYWTAKGQWDKCVDIGAPACGPLVAALKDTHKNLSKGAASALDKVGWRPGQDEDGALYWIAKGQWEKCIEIGAPAVAPLTAALTDEDWSARRNAAEVLVMLYQSDLLDETQKSLILAQRGRLSANHNDKTYHSDDRSSDCSNRQDDNAHTDDGIGVAFPI